MLLLCIAAAGQAVQAQEETAGWSYGDSGWRWSQPETGSHLWLGIRLQTRYSSEVEEPLVADKLRSEGKEGFGINRARHKIGGSLGRQLTFYHEYDWRKPQLLDLRATWKPISWFNLRAGQWKSEFSRERVDSSGKQQFVDRSIANYWFTVDRQNGLMASGRLAKGTPADSNWWLGFLNGNGLNSSGDGGRAMVVGRYQLNIHGRPLPFSQSSLKRYAQAHSSLAIAMVTNDSAFTRFSSSGGGQLPGYADGMDNQYRLKQVMLEYAWQRGGWSFQHELHLKEIHDRVSGGTRRLRGGYLQAGWFPAERFTDWPENLEFAVRAALVNPDSNRRSDSNEEFTLAANWFFNGHRNKLTADASYIGIDDSTGEAEGLRFRLQWDLSL